MSSSAFASAPCNWDFFPLETFYVRSRSRSTQPQQWTLKSALATLRAEPSCLMKLYVTFHLDLLCRRRTSRVTSSMDNGRRKPYQPSGGLSYSYPLRNIWSSSEPSTFDWHAIATLIVWTMTLFIQRADRRDTLAIHAKLDELLKATREARTEWLRSTKENRRLSRKFVTARPRHARLAERAVSCAYEDDASRDHE